MKRLLAELYQALHMPCIQGLNNEQEDSRSFHYTSGYLFRAAQ